MDFFDSEQHRQAGRDVETLARFLCRIPRADGRVASRHGAFLALGRLVAAFSEFMPDGLQQGDLRGDARARFLSLRTDTHVEPYGDVVAALHDAGLTQAFMGGAGGIDVIVVPLVSGADQGPELLIGENDDMLDLPERERLAGWRVEFVSHTSEAVTIYRGEPGDVPALVAAAETFARNNGWLPR